MSKPVETLYATVDRETLRQLQADSEELARIKAEHPIQKCLRENGELIALKATVAQQAKLIEALKAQPARQAGDERDSERLDWMINSQATVHQGVSPSAYCVSWDEVCEPHVDWYSTPREAIDAAMLAQQQEGEA